jgi:hypothetical protein
VARLRVQVGTCRCGHLRRMMFMQRPSRKPHGSLWLVCCFADPLAAGLLAVLCCAAGHVTLAC